MSRKFPASKKAIKPIPKRRWPAHDTSELWSSALQEVWFYIEDEFEERIVKHGSNCWSWLGAWHRQGYSLVTVRIAQVGSSIETSTKMNGQRLQMAIKLGRALDPNERVGCTCRNLECLNPDHLYITDYKHQCDHVDYSTFKTRVRKYTPAFLLQHQDALSTLGPVRLSRLYKVSNGTAQSMKTAYVRWRAGQSNDASDASSTT